jgi:hypothetical protein
MSYSEVHRLPLRYRRWFLDRLVKHFQDKNKKYNETKQANATNDLHPLKKLDQFESQIKSKL